MQHTPGPWKARGYRGDGKLHNNCQPGSIWIDCAAQTKSGASVAGTVAEAYKNGTGSNDPAVQEANACLIAAAPSLLAALAELLKFDSTAYAKGSDRAKALLVAKKAAWAAVARASGAER